MGHLKKRPASFLLVAALLCTAGQYFTMGATELPVPRVTTSWGAQLNLRLPENSCARIDGAIGDGKTDDRSAIQAHITASAGRTACIGPIAGQTVTTYLVGMTTITSDANTSVGALTIPSNTNIDIRPGVTLKAATSVWRQRGVLELTDVSNVKIYGGGKIDGSTQGTASVGIFGIRIRDGRHVSVADLEIFGMSGSLSAGASGGDSIYIGATSNTTTYDVTVERVKLHTNVRQGISIVRGSSIRLLNSHIYDITGTDPGSCIDLEPSAVGQTVSDILIAGNLFENCDSAVEITGPSGGKPTKVTVVDNIVRSPRKYEGGALGAALAPLVSWAYTG